MTFRVRSAAVMMTALALIAAACSDDPPPAPPEVFTPASGEGTDLTDPSTTLIPPTPEEPPEIEGPTLADFDIPCGRDAEPSSVAAATIGVDDTLITISTGNDIGARFAGSIGLGMPEAVTAMADHCSALGGLAGRGLAVLAYDAAVVEVVDRAADQCAETLAVVGAGYANGIDAAAAWSGCGLPVFAGWPDWLFSDVTSIEAHQFARFVDPEAGSVVSIVTPATTDGAQGAERVQRALAEAGFLAGSVIDYPLSFEPMWADVAAEVVASGAGLVHLEGSCADAAIPLLSALAAISDTPPAVVAGPSTYHPACIAQATADGVPTDRLLVQLPFLPLEDGDAAPVTMAFAEILGSYAAEVHGDALLASAAFWSFAVAADACANDLTRSCLAVGTTGEGAGLIRVADAACRVVVGVVDGSFERIVPSVPGTLTCPAAAE